MEIKDYIIGILFSLVVGLGLWLSIEIRSTQEVNKTVTTDSSTSVTRDTTQAPDTTRKIKADSIRVDTVFKDTLIETETDTFKTKPDSQENSEFTKIRNYETTVSDSLIEGTIKTTVQGYLVDQNFEYTPQYPLQVTVTKNTTIKRTVTKRLQPKPYPSIGLEGSTDFKTLRGFRVTGSWTLSNGNRFKYGYNPVLKTHTIGFSYNLRNIFR